MSCEIAVVAVGEVEAEVLAHVCSVLSGRFACTCQVGSALPVPDGACNPRRRQYAAQTILDQLQPGVAKRVLGVVDLDLYVPQLNFVFGLADVIGRRAVIALPRLRESFYGQPADEACFLARVAKEAVHELGHTVGLPHCRDERCVMAFSNSLADTDAKMDEFCRSCADQWRW